jgi:hypothetical protein
MLGYMSLMRINVYIYFSFQLEAIGKWPSVIVKVRLVVVVAVVYELLQVVGEREEREWLIK